jgi:hypothetical protein
MFFELLPLPSFLQSNILGSITADVIFALALIIIGVIIIVLIRLFLIFLPAILLAIVVYFLTGSAFWAGITFLVIAALSLLKKI